ncbi:hypothetical protein Amet_3663 [Alkaliphilus metalliredigens QYMF]|uniref:Uncharacterized protein n=1 Tax=Alkaliphilus metalliredigens (strain QYMF) TaxID=293826 RepID=A6TUB7_ALKMQ|nr:hypothetical protein [Alkaliphilus metalliredigens]ABR49785.1 hypothetical protein Amet_3663 [Alkaliphilus metalliredigens QYMF]
MKWWDGVHNIIQKGSIVKKLEVKDLLNEQFITWEVENRNKAIDILQERWGIRSTMMGESSIGTQVKEDLIQEINRVFFQENMSFDGLHPNSLGYEAIGKRMTVVIEPLFIEKYAKP